MSNSWKRIELLFLFLLIAQCVFSQHYVTRTSQLSIDHGLSNRIVHCINQDENGIMWFGTTYGLNKYNGYNFTVFTKEENQLQSNFIKKIFFDNKGFLWLLHNDSKSVLPSKKMPLSILNPLTNKIEEKTIFESAPFKMDVINNIVQTSDKTFFISTIGGAIYSYKNKFELIAKISQTDFLATSYYNKHSDTYWFCTNKGIIYTLDKALNILNINKQETCMYYADFCYGDEQNNVYLSTNRCFPQQNDFYERNHFLYKISPETLSKNAFELKGSIDTLGNSFRYMQKKCIFWEEKKQWINLLNGIEIFDLEGNLIYSSPPVIKEKERILDAYIDKNQLLWVSTDNGIYKVKIVKNSFINYLYNYSNGTKHTTYSVRGINQLGDNLYIGGYGPSIKINIKNNDNETNNNELQELNTLSKSVTEKEVSHLSIFKTSEDHLFFSDEESVLYEYDLSNNDWKTFSYCSNQTQDSLYVDGIWSLHEDSSSRIWVGLSQGLAFLEQDSNCIKPFVGYNQFELLSKSLIYHFHPTPEGIWIASNTGLYLLDHKKGIVARYSPDAQEDSFYLAHDVIAHIYEDSLQNFWLSTLGGGVIKWNRKTLSYKQYTALHGLPHNMICAIYGDSFNNLWISSYKGLAKFNKENEDISVYMPKDGIAHEEFNRVAHFQGEDGLIYFGGLNGVTAIKPENFQEDQANTAHLRITNFKLLDVNEGDYIDKTKDLLKEQSINLSSDANAFILEFSLLDFFAPEKTRYTYIIEGLDEQWYYQNENTIRINSLPYGSYTLRVKADSDGCWATSELNIQIHFPKPYYLQWWFILFFIFVLAMLIILYIQWRLFNLKKSKARLEKKVKKRTLKIQEQTEELNNLNQLKSRFFTNVSHELRTPLTLIVGPIGYLLKKAKSAKSPSYSQLQIVQNNAHRLLGLVDEILDLSKIKSSKIRLQKEPILLRDFIETAFNQFIGQASYRTINYQLKTTIDPLIHVLLDEGKMHKIINNLLSNAFKFTSSEGTIIFAATYADNVLDFQIEDTGIGIDAENIPHLFERYFQVEVEETQPNRGGAGIGLSFCKELIELLGGTITAKSELNKGSVFKVNVPLIKTTKPSSEKAIGEGIIISKEISLPVIEPNTLLRVLIVEDNLELGLFLKQIIGAFYQTVVVDNGQKALKVLETEGESISLVISDLMMPVMDGLQLLQHLKSNENLRSIPFIILTAKATLEDKIEALRIGVDDYLYKPFSTDELLARVHNLLENYQQRKAWHSKEIPSVQDQPTLVVISQEEQEWLKELEIIIYNKCSHSNFTINWLAEIMSISPSQLRRRLNKLAGMNTKKYVNGIRLQKARHLIKTKKYTTVTRVMYEVGFKKLSHFSKLYAEHFGCSPSQD